MRYLYSKILDALTRARKMESGGRAMPTVFMALVLVGLFLPVPVAKALVERTHTDLSSRTAGEEVSQKSGGADESGPTVASLGIYITSLQHLDPTSGSFGVDYWLWSQHPTGSNPLETLEFQNAEQAEATLGTTEEGEEQGWSWSQTRVSATVRHDWDVSNFPFDRQVLRIIGEATTGDVEEVVYRAAEAESGYEDNLAPDGWRVSGFSVEERRAEYGTTFGRPDTSGGSTYARVVTLIELERESVTGFFKLTIAAYAAIAITLLSFLIPSRDPSLFSARMALLVGSLFAVVLSMQASDEELGALDSVPLVDEVHILVILYALAAGLMAIISRKNSERGYEVLAHRWDVAGFYVFGCTFVLVNGLLVAMAAAAG